MLADREQRGTPVLACPLMLRRCHKISVTLEPLRPSKQPKEGQRLLLASMDQQVVKVKLPARVAYKSMSHAQKYLAQANRHIAELVVQAAHQRAVVRQMLDTGQGSEMAESLLDALEGSVRIFEKHRIFLLRLQWISSAAGGGRDGSELVTTQRAWRVMTD